MLATLDCMLSYAAPIEQHAKQPDAYSQAASLYSGSTTRQATGRQLRSRTDAAPPMHSEQRVDHERTRPKRARRKEQHASQGQPQEDGQAADQALQRQTELEHQSSSGGIGDAGVPSVSRVVWSYWPTGWHFAPDLVQACVKSWRMANPGWVLRLLDGNDYTDYISLAAYTVLPPYETDAFSDILQIELLRAHGGVWLDATVFTTQSLSAWLPLKAEFFALSRPTSKKPIATWLMSAKAGTHIVSTMCEGLRAWWQECCGLPNAVRAFGFSSQDVHKRALFMWIGNESKHRNVPSLTSFFQTPYRADREFRARWKATPEINARTPDGGAALFSTYQLQPALSTLTVALRMRIAKGPCFKLAHADLDLDYVSPNSVLQHFLDGAPSLHLDRKLDTPRRLLVYGAQHTATTTFSRLLADVDTDSLYHFEPDHPAKHAIWPAFTNPRRPIDLTDLLQCNASAWGGWEGFSRDSEWAPANAGNATRHCRTHSPDSHCSRSWTPCLSQKACATFNGVCSSRAIHALKSIELLSMLAARDGGKLPPAWADVPGLVLVHLVRDARSVFQSWWNREAAQLVNDAEQRVTFLKRIVTDHCALWRTHEAALTAHYKDHRTPLYLEVNVDNFTTHKGGYTAEMAVVERVRAIADLEPTDATALLLRMGFDLSASSTVGLEMRRREAWSTSPLLSQNSANTHTRAEQGTGERGTASSGWATLPHALLKHIEHECSEFLYEDQQVWELRSRGGLHHRKSSSLASVPSRMAHERHVGGRGAKRSPTRHRQGAHSSQDTAHGIHSDGTSASMTTPSNPNSQIGLRHLKPSSADATVSAILPNTAYQVTLSGSGRLLLALGASLVPHRSFFSVLYVICDKHGACGFSLTPRLARTEMDLLRIAGRRRFHFHNTRGHAYVLTLAAPGSRWHSQTAFTDCVREADNATKLVLAAGCDMRSTSAWASFKLKRIQGTRAREDAGTADSFGAKVQRSTIRIGSRSVAMVCACTSHSAARDPCLNSVEPPCHQ